MAHRTPHTPRVMTLAVLLLLLVLALLLSVLPALPAATARANSTPPVEHFQRVWDRTDKPVADGVATRTWMWGAPVSDVLIERYDDAPGGERAVRYFDKSRMEINDPTGDADSPWFVTNGLLAVELISGQLQLADYRFETRLPSELNVAGDQGFPNGPSYATLLRFWDARDFDPNVPFPRYPTPRHCADTFVCERLARSGVITFDEQLATREVTIAVTDEVTQRGIASVFWAFMTSRGTVWEDDAFVNDVLFENPLYATGRPITEPYWADIVVAGRERLVLLQCFERRCLTWTPDNPTGWQVEAGNIGQHYQAWRYRERPAVEGQVLFQREIADPVTGYHLGYDLYLVNADGSGLTNLTGDVAPPVSSAAWSPDGSRIAFAAGGDLSVMDADGSDRVQVTSGAETDAAPDWSPDGSQLAFQRQLGEHETQLFVVDADGSDLRQLTHIPPDPQNPQFSHSTAPRWSPDGGRIAFTNENRVVPATRVNAVYVIDADGSDLLELVPPERFYAEVGWSPDGRTIHVLRPQIHGRDLPGSGLYVVPGDGSSPAWLLAGEDYTHPYEPTWRPDGAAISVALTPVAPDHWPGTRGLTDVEVASGARTQLTHIGFDPDWSGDGAWLAFTFGLNPTGIGITDRSGLVQWVIAIDGQHPQWRPMVD